MLSRRYIGCPCEVPALVDFIDCLNSKVVKQITNSQELVMLTNFVQETNERQFLQSIKDRISDITSWHWVLQDLSKRLEEAVSTLKYEHNAVKVVIERINEELNQKSAKRRKLGDLCHMSDTVEEAILEEFNFLKMRRKKFVNILPEIEKQMNILNDMMRKIQNDILNKEQTINIEEACAKINSEPAVAIMEKSESFNYKKKRFTTMNKWVNRCQYLRDSGLLALRRSVILRQIIRGARVELSFAAQCHGARVDAALRKRLHYNVTQLEEVNWQKDEVLKDLISLEEELVSAEKSLHSTIDQKSVVMKRIRDRAKRPTGEKTVDIVDMNLREEMSCLKHFCMHLKQNIDRINKLRHQLKEVVSEMGKCADSISRVIEIDQGRMRARLDEEPGTNHNHTERSKQEIVQNTTGGKVLAPIEEVEENSDDEDVEYPFDF